MQKILAATKSHTILLNIVGKNFKVEVYREDDGEVVATKSFVKPSVKHLMEEINALKAKYIV